LLFSATFGQSLLGNILATSVAKFRLLKGHGGVPGSPLGRVTYRKEPTESSALEAAEKLDPRKKPEGFVSGHGFSRAARHQIYVGFSS
jgi:hypothetical protein